MAMNEHSDSVHEAAASGTGVHLVQSGWHVMSEDGQDLGPVTRLDGDRMVIDRSGLLTPGTLIVPLDLIGEEDEEAMQAFLTVDAATADEFAGDAS